jgi:hypothetical protein
VTAQGNCRSNKSVLKGEAKKAKGAFRMKKWICILCAAFLLPTIVVFAEEEYEIVGSFEEGLAIAVNSGGYRGFVDETGAVVIPFEYDWVYPFAEGLAVVLQNNRFGFLDKTGSVVVPIECEGMSQSGNEYYLYRNDGRFFYVNDGTVTIVEPAPSSVNIFVNGEATAFDAYEINGNNYFKILDLTAFLKKTERLRSVNWEEVENTLSNLSHSWVGELNGKTTLLDLYTINGCKYFRLWDVAFAFDFNVEWNEAENAVYIDASKGY